MSHAPVPTPPVDDNQQIAERREKLAAIRAQGIAFPNDFKPRDHAGDLHRVADGLDNEALEAAPISASIGGRMMLKRVMGKACFATLQDVSGRIQLYITLDKRRRRASWAGSSESHAGHRLGDDHALRAPRATRFAPRRASCRSR